MNNLQWLYENDEYLSSFAKLMACLRGYSSDESTAGEWLMSETEEGGGKEPGFSRNPLMDVVLGPLTAKLKEENETLRKERDDYREMCRIVKDQRDHWVNEAAKIFERFYSKDTPIPPSTMSDIVNGRFDELEEQKEYYELQYKKACEDADDLRDKCRALQAKAGEELKEKDIWRGMAVKSGVECYRLMAENHSLKKHLDNPEILCEDHDRMLHFDELVAGLEEERDRFKRQYEMAGGNNDVVEAQQKSASAKPNGYSEPEPGEKSS